MTRATDIFKRRGTSVGVRLLVLLFAGWTTGQVYAQDSSKEYQVKAACLLNFAQFIEWPASAMKEGEPFTIGVLGDDPFGNVLEQTFHDELVQGRKVVVKRSKQLDDLKSCQLIFVSKSEKEKLADILSGLGDSNAVTVGESDDFARRGGIVNFYFESNKVRFEINADAAQQKGLKINSQLLKRAKIVGKGKN